MAAKVSRRRPKGEWLLSEVAPFIRRILNRRATDADRTKVARELADWLEAHGDRGGYAKWFRHPKLRWEHHEWGISWDVRPWDNHGHGCGNRIDSGWWTQYYPTSAYLSSKPAEALVAAWLKNGVALEEYPWTRDVAARIGRLAEYDAKVADRARAAALRRQWAREAEDRDRKEYAELQRKYGRVYFEHGGGI